MESGDEKVQFTAIEFKCDNLYRDDDDAVVTEPWPLYGKRCREGTWNSQLRTCVTCPQSMEHLTDADRNQHLNVDTTKGEYAEFWGCHQESGGRCMCEGARNVEDPHMSSDPWMQQMYGGWVPTIFQPVRFQATPMAMPGCPGSNVSATGSRNMGGGECFIYEKFANEFMNPETSFILPDITCGSVTQPDGTQRPLTFGESRKFPKIHIAPSVEEDAVYTMLRLMQNFGFETPLQIMDSITVQENKVTILALSTVEQKGNRVQIGPTLEQLRDHCNIRFNIFKDRAGTKIQNNDPVALAQVPEIPPACTDTGMQGVNTAFTTLVNDFKANAAPAQDVTCTNNDMMGMAGMMMHRRRQLAISDSSSDLDIDAEDEQSPAERRLTMKKKI
jgi:hypothetical protein